MYSTEVGSAFSSLLPTPVTSCDMTLVLRDAEPQSLQSLLLPILMVDRHISNVHTVLHELLIVQDFLEDIHVPRALHAINLAIMQLNRTLSILEVYKLDRYVVLQHALNAHVARHGRAPFIDVYM